MNGILKDNYTHHGGMYMKPVQLQLNMSVSAQWDETSPIMVTSLSNV